MIKGQSKPYLEIDEKFILDKVSIFDIFRFYTPGLILGKSFSSPFRKDEDPSCVIKLSKTTQVPYYWDISKDSTMNCFQYVKALFGINYNEALHKICEDMGLVSNVKGRDYKKIITKYEQPILDKDYQRFDVFTRKPFKEEISYWNQRFLSIDEVKGADIYFYEKLMIDGRYVPKIPGLLSFAYYYSGLDRWKIYTPEADKAKGQKKWNTNVPLSHIEGLSRLRKDKLGIGLKSRKDCLLMRKFVAESIELQNETIASATETNLKYINEHTSEFYISFDSDGPGKKNSIKYTKENNYKHLNTPDYLLPEVNDWDGWVVNSKGLYMMENYLKEKKII